MALSVARSQSFFIDMEIDVVQLELRKNRKIFIDLPSDKIYSAITAAPLFCQEIGSLNIEHVAMLTMDNTNKVINYFIVAMGEIDKVKVPLSQMFRCALLSNASKIIIAHNHPSGILEITSKDIEMTKKIALWASNFSIELMDSLIVITNDYISIREHCEEISNGQKKRNKN